MERARLGGQSPEGMTPMELLERYLRSKDMDEERIRVVLDHARGIMEREA